MIQNKKKRQLEVNVEVEVNIFLNSRLILSVSCIKNIHFRFKDRSKPTRYMNVSRVIETESRISNGQNSTSVSLFAKFSGEKRSF